jgi:hypothetical protein
MHEYDSSLCWLILNGHIKLLSLSLSLSLSQSSKLKLQTTHLNILLLCDIDVEKIAAISIIYKKKHVLLNVSLMVQAW